MTLRKSEDLIPARPRWYKDCLITETKPISGRYALVEVKLPQPYGGYYEELVSWDVGVEVEQ